jgi:DNA-nicking Smr family endonuclease
MPPRRRGLNEADQALWAHYTRQVTPLAGKDSPSAPPPPPDPPAPPLRSVVKPRTAATGPVRRNTPVLAVGDQPSGLDKSTWGRFRSGKLSVARTLDLHGMTAQRAHLALIGFLRSAHADQVRVVEVVTGRGSGETGGVIRRELPLWLNLPDIRPMILGASHPHPLNPGSVRLILRRIR